MCKSQQAFTTSESMKIYEMSCANARILPVYFPKKGMPKTLDKGARMCYDGHKGSSSLRSEPTTNETKTNLSYP